MELYERYPEANFELFLGLVWIHDYGKIIGLKDEKEIVEKSMSFLLEIRFEDEYVKELIRLVGIFESKMTLGLSEAPIEVRIVSTADAISHMYGPFYQIYCYENPEMSIEELMESNLRKLQKDWDRKIVLPGIKEELQARHDF